MDNYTITDQSAVVSLTKKQTPHFFDTGFTTKFKAVLFFFFKRGLYTVTVQNIFFCCMKKFFCILPESLFYNMIHVK